MRTNPPSSRSSTTNSSAEQTSASAAFDTSDSSRFASARKHRAGQLHERVFDAGAGQGTRPDNGPPVLGDLPECLVVDLPFRDEVGLVHGKNEWYTSRCALGGLLQRAGGVERELARPVRNQQISGRAAEIRRADTLERVLPVDIPEHQSDRVLPDCHRLLVDFYADAGHVFVREDAADETRDEAGLADPGGPEHADLLLNHR